MLNSAYSGPDKGVPLFEVVQSGTNRYTAEQVVHFGTPKTAFAAHRGTL
ncbi:hypothetical protein KHS38_08075 [Mucilaginibacter sp. Bleaf8]|nr:hypothetical protein [Mucilaginibacter sp. Bleaf8]MBS7564361.1 hypothetical protein [Mucilaginibacter sp. Bleaf8]